MSIKRIIVLLKKEFALGSKSFIFIWAIASPILVSFMMSVIFGLFFARAPRLGLYVEGESEILSKTQEVKAITTKEFTSMEALKNAVKDGVIDIGVVIPDSFDESIKSGTKTTLTSFVFGESYAKNRAIIVTTLGNVIRNISGGEIPIEIQSISVGEGEVIPASERFFPLIALMAIMFGGLLVPSTSLIEEKRKKTIDALRVSTSTLTEVITSKFLLGTLLSIFTGVFTLLLNKALGNYPFHMVLAMVLGGVMASFIGILLGIYLKDFATLLSFWKLGGIILFFPAIVYMFPKIPQIVSKFFPTYYVLEPIVALSKGSIDFRTFWINLAVCLLIDIALGVIIFTLVKKMEATHYKLLEEK